MCVRVSTGTLEWKRVSFKYNHINKHALSETVSPPQFIIHNRTTRCIRKWVLSILYCFFVFFFFSSLVAPRVWYGPMKIYCAYNSFEENIIIIMVVIITCRESHIWSDFIYSEKWISIILKDIRTWRPRTDKPAWLNIFFRLLAIQLLYYYILRPFFFFAMQFQHDRNFTHRMWIACACAE